MTHRPTRAPVRWAALVLGLALSGCATRHAIVGKVVDRNGEPMSRVIVSLQPGSVELLTDNEGAFAVDYLRDDDGKRTKLKRRNQYTIETFRTGFQTVSTEVDYRRGELHLAAIIMPEETIRVAPGLHAIDPSTAERPTSTGATYEGE
mgnify:CR=1 FL=1